VATDLSHWDEKDYLIVVDYYSRYFEVTHLSTTTSKYIVKQMKSIFSRFGIPEKVVSDNGPQYSSSEFTKFASDNGFRHDTSSPKYPQSNGLAERTVQTVRRIFQKCKRNNLGILEYRNTPIDNLDHSPAELLQGRQLRSLLPVLPSQLATKALDHHKVATNTQISKDKATKT
jgi:transposase InsO family protein